MYTFLGRNKEDWEDTNRMTSSIIGVYSVIHFIIALIIVSIKTLISGLTLELLIFPVLPCLTFAVMILTIASKRSFHVSFSADTDKKLMEIVVPTLLLGTSIQIFLLWNISEILVTVLSLLSIATILVIIAFWLSVYAKIRRLYGFLGMLKSTWETICLFSVIAMVAFSIINIIAAVITTWISGLSLWFLIIPILAVIAAIIMLIGDFAEYFSDSTCFWLCRITMVILFIATIQVTFPWFVVDIVVAITYYIVSIVTVIVIAFFVISDYAINRARY